MIRYTGLRLSRSFFLLINVISIEIYQQISLNLLNVRMKKPVFIALLFWIQVGIGQNETSAKTGGLKASFLNEKKQPHRNLHGQLYLNEKIKEFKTDSDGGLFIKDLTPGKYAIKIKTDKCCTFEVLDVPVYSDKITYFFYQIPLKSNPKDTCTKREKYETPKPDPNYHSSAVPREEYEKIKNKSIGEILEESEKKRKEQQKELQEPK